MASFHGRVAVTQWLDVASSDAVANLLESILTAEQIAMMEATVFPPAVEQQRLDALKAAHAALCEAGIPADNASVSVLAKEIESAQESVARAAELTEPTADVARSTDIPLR